MPRKPKRVIPEGTKPLREMKDTKQVLEDIPRAKKVYMSNLVGRVAKGSNVNREEWNKRRQFAELLVLTGRARESCAKIWPDETNPDEKASRLMANPKVKKLVQVMREEVEQELAMTREKILKEHAAIGFSDITNYIDMDTGMIYEPKKLKELPAHIRRAISEMHVWVDQAGVMHAKVKLWNKQASLDSAAKIEGLFKDTPDFQQAIFITKGLE
jgi:phage terminase small subunit